MSSGVRARAVKMACALFALLGMAIPTAWSQADVQGQWNTLPYSMTINPIHVALMHNGKILAVTGSGNCPPSLSGCPSGPPYGGGNHSGAVVLDPVAQSITQLSVGWDMFCNAMTALSDGRVFINGGTIAYDPFEGSSNSSIFDPATNTFTGVSNMAHGRWYPTVTMLGDGRIMTFSGADENSNTNTAVEIYTVGSGWSTQYIAPFTPDLYPRMHLLPNGKVFASGAPPASYIFDPSSKNFTQNVATTNYGQTRTYGSAVLLPLTPANNYDPQVMILGGNSPATETTEIIDLGSSSPAWQWGPNMSQPRIEMDAVLLPTGKVLALGGSLNDEDASTASLNADLYDPEANTFSAAGANVYARLYHSVALLLPDATVWIAGGNPSRGTYESHMEIYQPAYLFTRDGNNNVVPSTRPTISSAPGTIAWGGSFTVTTPDAANISQAVLVHPGASTHAFDMDQRLVGLSFTAGSGTLSLTAPPNGNIAPPGYYMLFLINNQGVPSVASFVLLSNSSSAPAPTVNSVSPNSGSSIGGTTVTITGANFLAGATVSFGGTSATGVTVASSTSITATTPSHSSGAVNVVVTNSDGQKGTLTGGYTYSNPAPTVTSITPNTGPDAGGVGVTISGANFLSGATVSFGGTSATGVTVASSTSITATTPSHSSGAVNVVVTNSDGQKGTLTSGYTYSNPAPTVTSITPNTGPDAGGVGVTISGANFLSGATVSFGGTAATGVTVASGSAITATTPAHAAGAVNVVVTNSDDQSGTLSNTYTYMAPDFTMSASALAPAAVTAGGSATAAITITPQNGFNGTVSLSCSSIAPSVTAPLTCAFAPVSVQGSGTSTLTVRAAASAQGSLAPRSRRVFYAMWLPLGGLLLLGTGRTSRKRKFFSALLVCVLCSGMILLVACGGGGASFGSSTTTVPGTPAGAYTITVSASGSVTHTTTLTLTVK